MRVIFVDGYNVINSWPELAELTKLNFEASRQKLIDLLQDYAAYNGCRIYIVFDAHLIKGSLEKTEKLNNNLYIVFTKYSETADSYIERSVDSIGRKIDVCVVTSDSLVQQLAFQRGATRMSSMEFFYEVKSAHNSIKVKTEKNFSEKRHLLADRVEKDVLEKLEKIRRER